MKAGFWDWPESEGGSIPDIPLVGDYDTIPILYTTHCSNCIMLEEFLKEKKINFRICDDKDLMKSLKIFSAPMLLVNDEKMDIKRAMEWVERQESKENV